MLDALDAILKANDLVAVLGREVSVRLVDISGSGCLLESGSRLDEGTTGSLRVSFEGLEYADDVRIMRCRPSEGSSSLYYLGAEFLWTTSPGDRSLRRVLASLQATAVKAGKFEAPRM
ncbi:MAG TPA: PilZ domain-containing protein [Vicinamibacterales bacterium]|jgi:hypothetical protein|nr:PilZ domain-containing protein [Vicinamibacterales bacterium]